MDLLQEIKDLRTAIRKIRDARGDDRCWLDYYELWSHIGITFNLSVFKDSGLGMGLCRRYYELCRLETADPVPPDAILDPAHWDNDLVGMTSDRLSLEVTTLREEIRFHYSRFMNYGFEQAVQADRDLFLLLPEKLPADFRLPTEDEFLGEKLAPNAGCASFWRSHQTCGVSCNLHKWGPCSAVS